MPKRNFESTINGSVCISTSEDSLCCKSQPAECPICLEAIRKPVELPCSHVFCEHCIRKWKETRRCVTCPLCRKVVGAQSTGPALKPLGSGVHVFSPGASYTAPSPRVVVPQQAIGVDVPRVRPPPTWWDNAPVRHSSVGSLPISAGLWDLSSLLPTSPNPFTNGSCAVPPQVQAFLREAMLRNHRIRNRHDQPA